MKIFFRRVHRWLGLLMVVQITAWMASGLYFAIFPIEIIRGEHLVAEPDLLQESQLEGLAPPLVAWQAVHAAMGMGAKINDISLYFLEGKVYYRVSGQKMGGEGFTRLVAPDSGALMAFLDEKTAVAIANRLTVGPAKFISAKLISEAPSGVEYRGRALPLWQVSYSEPEALRLYMDGWTGEIVARRTTRWRIFDFLWMLHIMDFDERDDFNTPLLQVSAALGLILALSGLVYWALTTRLFRRRRALPG